MTRMLPIDSHLGHWERHLWRPAAGGALEGVIDQAQYFDGTAKHRLGRVLPHASIKLVVSLDQPYGEVTPRAVTPFAWAYLAGVPTGPVTIEAPDRRVRTLNVRLHPTGVHRLLGLPLSELTGRAVDLRDLFGPGSAELLERCHETNGQQECVACLVRWLDEALRRSEQPDATGSAVAWAAGRIERSGGTVSVTALREQTGLTKTRFATAFRERVGITPKRYARLVRFRRAFALLHQPGKRSLSDVALMAGYFDQAHMTAEFRELGGFTPRQGLTVPRFSDDIIAAPPTTSARTFFQDR